MSLDSDPATASSAHAHDDPSSHHRPSSREIRGTRHFGWSDNARNSFDALSEASCSPRSSFRETRSSGASTSSTTYTTTTGTTTDATTGLRRGEKSKPTFSFLLARASEANDRLARAAHGQEGVPVLGIDEDGNKMPLLGNKTSASAAAPAVTYTRGQGTSMDNVTMSGGAPGLSVDDRSKEKDQKKTPKKAEAPAKGGGEGGEGALGVAPESARGAAPKRVSAMGALFLNDPMAGGGGGGGGKGGYAPLSQSNPDDDPGGGNGLGGGGWRAKGVPEGDVEEGGQAPEVLAPKTRRQLLREM